MRTEALADSDRLTVVIALVPDVFQLGAFGRDRRPCSRVDRPND